MNHFQRKGTPLDHFQQVIPQQPIEFHMNHFQRKGTPLDRLQQVIPQQQQQHPLQRK